MRTPERSPTTTPPASTARAPSPGRRPTDARFSAGLAAATLVLLAGGPSPAMAAGAEVHEEAVLEAPASTVAAGGELALTGRDFAAGEDHRLRLVGPLDEHDLGDISPDSAGTFERPVRIPREASPGRYQLEAVAPDGDVVARLSLTVVAASGAQEGRAAGEDAEGASATADREATDAELEIGHTRSALDWTVILLLLGAAAGAGVTLLRRKA